MEKQELQEQIRFTHKRIKKNTQSFKTLCSILADQDLETYKKLMEELEEDMKTW